MPIFINKYSNKLEIIFFAKNILIEQLLLEHLYTLLYILYERKILSFRQIESFEKYFTLRLGQFSEEFSFTSVSKLEKME